MTVSAPSAKKADPAAVPAQLVKKTRQAEAFARHWAALKKGERIVLDHIVKEALPFAAAVVAQALADRRVWFIAPEARTQEQLHGEMHAWGSPALFFPRTPVAAGENALPDPDATAERLTVLARVQETQMGKGRRNAPIVGPERLVVICADSLDEIVPAKKDIEAQRRPFQVGERLDVETLLNDFTEAGYERVPVVTERGQFSRRGGIVDVFSWQGEEPLRMEFLDDEIESLRAFDLNTQTSVKRYERVALLLQQADLEKSTAKVRDYIGPEDLLVGLEWDATHEEQWGLQPHVVITAGAATDAVEEDFSTAIFENPLGVFHAGDFVMQEARRTRFMEQIEQWRAEKWRVTMFFANEGERERFSELLGADWLEEHKVDTALALLHRGFTVPAAKLAVLTGAEVFGRHQYTRRVRGSKLDEAQVLRKARDMVRELREGDLVVHADYGVGKYAGIAERDAGGKKEEVMVIRYAEEAKLFVPLTQAQLVSRYVGVGGKAPTLNKLGDNRWGKVRQQAERSVEEFAARMLSIAAERQTLTAYAHPPDTKWQVEFEHSFLFRETPDQLRSIEEIKRDMEQAKPMDRLLCGDVGFGKTEVAIRAVFKCVMGGRQAAVLVPTTVLAQQHLNTFRERMSDYPVRVEMLCRLTPPKKEKEILEGLREGTVDIVIGTHRIISKDVRFKQLGLVVVDEEQRFGVKHKERFKELFKLLDVLTLSATPIPRTLYLGLMGMRDMSTLETPPPNRIPVQTTVCGYDDRLIREAIDKEMERGGQVFFLHNRVLSIEKMKAKIEALCPKARVIVGHGQMEKELLEDVMQTFISGEADVLVCTTIIESGVDIPNANTIIIDRADRFGLADLYQLRGRVGRGGERAHAYLMLQRDMMTVGDARKRVNAIKQYTALGSGFKIAMRDLEIRGAGNLLGTEQSGHIAAVGFDLYCQMLKTATARMQNRRVATPMDVGLRIDFLCTSEAQFAQGSADGVQVPAFIPRSYMEDARTRITAYRMLGEVATRKELEQLSRDWQDQFGPLPPSLENLLECTSIRLAATQARISDVEIKEGKVMLSRHGQFLQVNGRFPRLTGKTRPLQLKEILPLLRSF